jgi:abortive infection protein
MSLFSFVFIINWLYYKSGRNVLVVILFHLVANVSNEIFATHPDSKVIQTGLFALLMGYILVKERKLFFSA